MRSRDWSVSEHPHSTSIGSRRPARPPSSLVVYTALHRSRRLQPFVHPAPLPPPIVIVLHRHVAPREAEEEGDKTPGWSRARTCGSATGCLLMESGRFEDDRRPSITMQCSPTQASTASTVLCLSGLRPVPSCQCVLETSMRRKRGAWLCRTTMASFTAYFAA